MKETILNITMTIRLPLPPTPPAAAAMPPEEQERPNEPDRAA